MAKITLPEISNWLKGAENSIYHTFTFSSLNEKKRIKKLIEAFISKHKNYYICKEEDNKLVLAKKECQII